MANFKNLKDLSISIPSDGKYKIGTKSHLVIDVAQLKPKFAFDYISVRGGTFCYDSNLLGKNHYLNIIKGLKEASKYTFKDLEDSHTFHFHNIDFDEVTIRRSDFYKAILGEYNDEDYIVPYQMKVCKEERIIGFLYEGTFYLVMFDKGHNAYERKKNANQKRKKKR